MAGSDAYERLEDEKEQQQLQQRGGAMTDASPSGEEAGGATTASDRQHQHHQTNQYPIAVATAAPAGAVPTAVAMPVGGLRGDGQPLHAASVQSQIPLGGYHPGYGMPPHATGVLHVPDLPDAVQAWNGMRHLMALWMAFSICMVRDSR